MRSYPLAVAMFGVALLGLHGQQVSGQMQASGEKVDAHGDPLPTGAFARLGTERLRHAGPITSVAFSLDGNLLSAGTDGPPKVWNSRTGKEVRRFAGFRCDVRCMAVSPDGTFVAVSIGDSNNPVHLWKTATGKVYSWTTKHMGYVHGLAFSPDSKSLATAEQDGSIRLWEVRTGNEVRRFTAFPKGKRGRPTFLSVAFSPDGQTLISNAKNGPVCLWKVGSGELLHRVQAGKGFYALAFSPDSKTFALAGGDGISLWKTATGTRVRRLEGHRGLVIALAFAPDGRTLVSGGYDQTVRLWDMASGRELHRFLGHSSFVEAVAFSPDGKLVASGGRDQRVRLWEVAAGRELHPVQGHQASLWSLAFSRDGKMLASGGADHAVCLWDVTSHKLLRRLEGHTGQITVLAFSPDGKTLASTAASPDRTARLWDVASGKLLRQFKSDDRTGFGSLGFSADGKKLAAGGNDGTIRLWDLATDKELRVSRCGGRIPYHVFSSEAGDTLTATTFRQVIYAWALASGTEHLRVECKMSFLRGRAVSTDGRSLAEHDTNQIYLWELATAKERLRIPHKEWTWALAFPPDGKRLIGALDRAIAVWDLATGREVGRVAGLSSPALVLALAPDGKTLASGGSNGAILLWDVARLPKVKKAAPRELSATDLEAEWQALGGDDASRAYRALTVLRTTPRQVLPLLRRDLRPAASPDPKRIAALIEELNSDKATVRAKATEELEKLAGAAEAALRKALEARPSADMELRLRQLLKRAVQPTQEHLRTLRRLELLEHIGTPEARQLLKTLAANKSDAWLAAEARAAESRLRQRDAKP